MSRPQLAAILISAGIIVTGCVLLDTTGLTVTGFSLIVLGLLGLFVGPGLFD